MIVPEYIFETFYEIGALCCRDNHLQGKSFGKTKKAQKMKSSGMLFNNYDIHTDKMFSK
jgi:hypothetical protein